MRAGDLFIGQTVLIKSRVTDSLYICEIISSEGQPFGDLRIRLTDDEYSRYLRDGVTGGQSWSRTFATSVLYLYNDQNDILFWKGK